MVKIKSDMTDEELDKEIAVSWKRTKKWWNSLSDEEKKKEAEKAENSRLWEDWTDCDCGSMTGDNSQSEQLHQEKAQSVCTRNSGKITQN